MCSTVQADSKPAASAACTSSTARAGSTYRPVLQYRSPLCLPPRGQGIFVVKRAEAPLPARGSQTLVGKQADEPSGCALRRVSSRNRLCLLEDRRELRERSRIFLLVSTAQTCRPYQHAQMAMAPCY